MHFECLAHVAIIRINLFPRKKNGAEPGFWKLLQRGESQRCQLQHSTGKLPGSQSCSSLEILTDALENPLGLVLPPDPEEIDGDAREDDDKADPAFHGRHPEGNSDEEQAGQDEEDGQGDVHLGREQGTA